MKLTRSYFRRNDFYFEEIGSYSLGVTSYIDTDLNRIRYEFYVFLHNKIMHKEQKFLDAQDCLEKGRIRVSIFDGTHGAIVKARENK